MRKQGLCNHQGCQGLKRASSIRSNREARMVMVQGYSAERQCPCGGRRACTRRLMRAFVVVQQSRASHAGSRRQHVVGATAGR
ncbi:hypothetical protein VFPBJ_08417 [Purpureocillium lilacinum]|uniref:Uncharacterized protein n=1 Tax=Purpureocillium lilacinum TaxID=33203 RepID=A0A179GDZ0_PURLI|nr:hypothetical protein VFPBJ_08417 [Purpureocillium lilacinum]